MNWRVSMALVLVLTVTACGSGAAEETTTTAPTSTIASTTTTAPATTTSSTTTTIPSTAPLTGLVGPEVAQEILIVKVSNAPKARPQVGLEATDMVIEVLVEGGVSRLISFFQATYPEVVGPVRSVREVDPKLVAPFDARVAHSGGQAVVIAALRKVAVDEGGAAAYYRDPDRPAPYDYMLEPGRLPERAWDGVVPRLLTFSATPPPGGVPATSIEIDMSPIHTVNWVYEDGRYLRSNGQTPHLSADGMQLDAATVVVIYARQFDTGRRDSAGAMVPDYEVTGSGDAIVFRDGIVVEGSWVRESIEAFFTFFDASGRRVDVKPGRTWFELVPIGRSVTWKVS